VVTIIICWKERGISDTSSKFDCRIKVKAFSETLLGLIHATHLGFTGSL
jgi:hypothetical protein